MIFDMPTCGGCRTCELACSYYHEGDFNPALSSIIIHEKEMGKGFFVEIAGENDGSRIACDGCETRKVPLCMEYCEEIEELEKIIKEYTRRNEVKRKATD